MNSNAKIERISEIIAFILHLMGGEAYSKTKLMKLIYLLDVIQARNNKLKFSGATFRSYYYGPYSDDIEESLLFLQELGYISVNHRVGQNRNTFYHFRLKDMPRFGQLTDNEKLLIKQNLSSLIELDLNELLEISYATKEFKQSSFNKVIEL
jgi:uncharacterized protein YwgA